MRSMKKSIKKQWPIIFLVVFSAMLYAFTLRGMYGNLASSQMKHNLDQATKPFELSPERSRYILVESLVHNKTFALSQDLAEAAYPDVGYHNGKYYTYFAPGVSILTAPFYMAGYQFQLAQVFTYAAIALFAIATIVFLYAICRNVFSLPQWAALLSPIVFAFGSVAWGYATTLYQHHVTTFLMASSFYAVWNFKQRSKHTVLWALYVWLAFGIATFIDYPNVLLFAPVMVYFCLSSVHLKVVKERLHFSINVPFIATSVICLALLVLHGYYNLYNFGDFKTVSGSLTGYKEIKEAQQRGITVSNLEVAKMQAEKSPVNFFSEESFPKGFYTLTVSPDRGLFFYSPVFVLAFIGIWLAKKKSSLEHSVLLATIAINFFLYSSWSDPWGGWAFGPRYLIPTMAILSIYLGVFLTQKKHAIVNRGIFYVLFLFSASVSLLGALTTNAVPPKVEALYLHTGYNFLLNLRYLFSGNSSSFLYNSVFVDYVTLGQYYIVLLMCLALAVYVLLFADAAKKQVTLSRIPRLAMWRNMHPATGKKGLATR